MEKKKNLVVLSMIFGLLLLAACSATIAPKWDATTHTLKDNQITLKFKKAKAFAESDWLAPKIDKNGKIVDSADKANGHVALRFYYSVKNEGKQTKKAEDLLFESLKDVTQGGETLARLTIVNDKEKDKADETNVKPGQTYSGFITFDTENIKDPVKMTLYANDKKLTTYTIALKDITPDASIDEALKNNPDYKNASGAKWGEVAQSEAKASSAKANSRKANFEKAYDSVKVNKKANFTWTKADYKSLKANSELGFADDNGKFPSDTSATSLADVLAKFPEVYSKQKLAGDKQNGYVITVVYDLVKGNTYREVSLIFSECGDGSYRLSDKSEENLK